MFRSIIFPTDFSDKSEKAFIHALKIAIEEQSDLTILYADQEDDSDLDWQSFPQVRKTLSDWNLIQKDISKEEIYDILGIKINKVISKDVNIVESVLGLIHQYHGDLLVLATEGREGLPRWLNPSLAEPISRKAHIPTLFVPQGSKCFVSPDNGNITVKNILVPIDHKPNCQQSIDTAVAFLHKFGSPNANIHVFHVWEEGAMPDYEISGKINYDSRCKPLTTTVSKDILVESSIIDADVLIMPTQGRHGFLDLLLGTTSEKVLRHAPCPVLSVPSI